jgi:DedD protein
MLEPAAPAEPPQAEPPQAEPPAPVDEPEPAKPAAPPPEAKPQAKEPPATKPEAKAKPELKPPVAPATSKPAPKAPATQAATGGYYLQLGVFSSQANASQLIAKAKVAGFKASATQVGGQFKVRVGPISERDRALDYQAKLKARGLDNVLVEP